MTPGALGDPVPAEEAVALAGFEPSLPSGPPPDEVYVVDSPFGDPGLLYAWRPSATYPALPGTEWGLVLIAFQGDDETVVKSVQEFEDVHDASVGGGAGGRGSPSPTCSRSTPTTARRPSRSEATS